MGLSCGCGSVSVYVGGLGLCAVEAFGVYVAENVCAPFVTAYLTVVCPLAVVVAIV